MADPAWLGKITAEHRAEAERLLRRRDLTPRLGERLGVGEAAALGQGEAGVAAWSGRSARRVGYWLGRFLTGGAAALSDAPRPGRPARAGAGYLAELEAAVETPPAELGLPFDVWTSARLAAYLAERTGVRISPGWLRARLSRRNFVSGRPKHTLKHLQDAAEVAAGAAQLPPAAGQARP